MNKDSIQHTGAIFDINLFINGNDGLKMLESMQLNHIPVVGSYIVPASNRGIYRVEAVIHDETSSSLVLEEAGEQSGYNSLVASLETI